MYLTVFTNIRKLDAVGMGQLYRYFSSAWSLIWSSLFYRALQRAKRVHQIRVGMFLDLVQLLAGGGAVLEGYSMESRIWAHDRKITDIRMLSSHFHWFRNSWFQNMILITKIHFLAGAPNLQADEYLVSTKFSIRIWMDHTGSAVDSSDRSPNSILVYTLLEHGYSHPVHSMSR